MSVESAPIFTGTSLYRAEKWRKDENWLRARLEDPASRAVAADADRVLLEPRDHRALARLALPATTSENGSEAILLGLEGDRALFAVKAEPDAPTVPLRDAGAVLPASEAGLAAYLVTLLGWHRRHRFCANCGTATEVTEAGYSRHCPNCGASHFPRLDPVVIMLVEHARSVLLGRRAGWPPGRFSALAGFVSSGESVEEAVLREVYEESGIRAYRPRFVASQPWPFPSSLMLGFHAYSDGGEPLARDRELEEVRWFTAEQLRDALDGHGSGELQLPPRIAIARLLIERWITESERSR